MIIIIIIIIIIIVIIIINIIFRAGLGYWESTGKRNFFIKKLC